MYRAARFRVNQLDFEGQHMAPSVRLRSPYDQRVELVKDTILAHSKLDDDEATALAVRVLRALQSLPEQIR